MELWVFLISVHGALLNVTILISNAGYELRD